MQTDPKKVPAEIASRLIVWNRSVQLLRFVQIFLGVVGVGCAIAIATFTAELSPLCLKSIAFAAALCTGLISAFDITGKANAMRRAWRHLNVQILRFDNLPDSKIDHLIDIYSQAEEMIGGVGFEKPAAK